MVVRFTSTMQSVPVIPKSVNKTCLKSFKFVNLLHIYHVYLKISKSICNLYSIQQSLSNKATPIKGHPSYQDRFKMHYVSKILLIPPPLFLKRGYPSYEANFSYKRETTVIKYEHSYL